MRVSYKSDCLLNSVRIILDLKKTMFILKGNGYENGYVY